MSDSRSAIYFPVTGATTTFLKLQLDTDLYSVAVLAKVGGFNTVADGSKIIPINKRYALASGLVKQFKAKCERGEDPNKKTRSVPILVGAALADTVATDAGLVGDTLKLGQGATPVSWTVKSVVS
jgi:hypothetical protein